MMYIRIRPQPLFYVHFIWNRTRHIHVNISCTCHKTASFAYFKGFIIVDATPDRWLIPIISWPVCSRNWITTIVCQIHFILAWYISLHHTGKQILIIFHILPVIYTSTICCGKWGHIETNFSQNVHISIQKEHRRIYTYIWWQLLIPIANLIVLVCLMYTLLPNRFNSIWCFVPPYPIDSDQVIFNLGNLPYFAAQTNTYYCRKYQDSYNMGYGISAHPLWALTLCLFLSYDQVQKTLIQ